MNYLKNESTFGDVEVEEIHVENSLDTSGNDGDTIKHAFLGVAVVPVDNVQCTEIVGCKNVAGKSIITGKGPRRTSSGW